VAWGFAVSVFVLTIQVRPKLLSPVCIYSLFHVLFSLFGRLFYIFDFTVAHGDRKYYYVKVVESIQFVCSGISGSCRDVSAIDTYRSTVHDIPHLCLCSGVCIPSGYYLNYFCSLHST
jgi:hypothetical protein